MYNAQLDEASIMQHTGHRSVNGVYAYKRCTGKLKELTSAVLNGATSVRPRVEESKYQQAAEKQKENSEKGCPNLPALPWIFEGASGFTINFK